MKVNLNDNIWVKFNDNTDECLLKNHKELYRENADKVFPYKPKANKDGWVNIQLWEMARMFGPYMGVGFWPPIETTIYIGEEPPERERNNDR